MNTSSVIDPSVLTAINGNLGSSAPQSTSEELSANFMTLLITQLKNQDPLNPLENAELTSQLAQINTVSGIETLNKTLNGIVGQIEAGQSMQAVGLIGKGVMIPGNRVLAGEEGSTTPFGIELAAPAKEVTVSIVDGSGQIVRSFELGPVKAGVESFVWDGTLEGGELAPKGSYRVQIEAVSEEGNPLPATILHYAVVQAVTNHRDGPLLDLGGISDPVVMSDIRQIL